MLGYTRNDKFCHFFWQILPHSARHRHGKTRCCSPTMELVNQPKRCRKRSGGNLYEPGIAAAFKDKRYRMVEDGSIVARNCRASRTCVEREAGTPKSLR